MDTDGPGAHINHARKERTVVKASHILRYALAAPAILSSEKSFRRNVVIGSRALNARGLHRKRVALAAKLAARRRAALANRLDPAEREAFDRDGFVIRANALPAALHEAVVEDLSRTPRQAWQMRQGQTINRAMLLPARDDGSPLAALADFVYAPAIRDLVGYAAGHRGNLLAALQTVAVDPAAGDADPQANLHADTFHPTAKLWLFLHDVGEEDGPFSFVPGSHRLTPERLEWEDRQARTATLSEDVHHAAGSFRLSEDGLAALGYGTLQTFPVKANTLVVADTFGFHRRTPSTRPTVRTSVYGIMRRNPFLPWNGLDPLDLPPLKRRTMQIYLAMQDRRARAGKRVVYTRGDVVLAGSGFSADP